MPFLLRKVTRPKWYPLPWLADGEFQADAFVDLRTRDNKLSVWQVDDERKNLTRLITALAANGNKPDNLDYALLDLQVIQAIGITIATVNGDTPDKAANMWHRDLVELSAARLFDLARAIHQHGSIERIPKKQIIGLIHQSIEAGHFEVSDLKPDLANKLRLSTND
ncbi:MAG: hypothetical protein D6737_00620 [Chloroflexi bacterium]|nr:MAG: hypothetical protein D6737_00620 [Chloroflexota bacterium]